MSILSLLRRIKIAAANLKFGEFLANLITWFAFAGMSEPYNNPNQWQCLYKKPRGKPT